jgi:hypothetical protein
VNFPLFVDAIFGGIQYRVYKSSKALILMIFQHSRTVVYATLGLINPVLLGHVEHGLDIFRFRIIEGGGTVHDETAPFAD